MNSKLICTVCPNGCKMDIFESDTGNNDISGYSCERGKVYAEQEILNPVRILTTTVKIKNGYIKRLPVRSKEPISKNIIPELVKILKAFEAVAPIKEGDVIIEDISGTGVSIVASKSILKI